jgi:hypothetical protein
VVDNTIVGDGDGTGRGRGWRCAFSQLLSISDTTFFVVFVPYSFGWMAGR